MYIMLGFTVRQREEMLLLYRKALSHLNQAGLTREWPMVFSSTSIYELARKSLLNILERDKAVQDFFQLD